MAYQQAFALSPDLDTPTVLSLQHQHCSTAIWKANDSGLLTNPHQYDMHGWMLNNCFRPYVLIV